MDLPIQWTLGLLKGFLPETSVEFLQTHLLDQSSPAQSLKRQAFAIASASAARLYPVLEPAADRAMQFMYSAPDAVVLVFLLVVVVAVYQFLALVRRIMMFWTRLAMRLLFWSAVGALVAVAYQRGLEATVHDAVVIGSKLFGYAMTIKDVFWREYQRWDAQQRHAQQAQNYRNAGPAGAGAAGGRSRW
ncbi:hypothetical protein B0H63DRAFT_453863 [Podospora didyma]|uniref:Uncharacterized protein n=1 Tax=Podospora didyma TaxID=330526 RepID=A0AAE0KAP6_9PEZI|nr:hypothetical protein B0H63DRAFT_453863 [Podospora didyma]